jgi:sulfide:quinone oxidoreductase
MALQGRWISGAKTAFEKYFLEKLRVGWPMPWFERWILQAIGLPLVETLPPEDQASLIHPVTD